MTHFVFRRKKVTKMSYIQIQTTLNLYIFNIWLLLWLYIIHFLLPSEGIFRFFPVVVSPSLASQAYLENKVINCVTGISAFVKKKSILLPILFNVLRFRGHFVDSVCTWDRDKEIDL